MGALKVTLDFDGELRGFIVDDYEQIPAQDISDVVRKVIVSYRSGGFASQFSANEVEPEATVPLDMVALFADDPPAVDGVPAADEPPAVPAVVAKPATPRKVK